MSRGLWVGLGRARPERLKVSVASNEGAEPPAMRVGPGGDSNAAPKFFKRIPLLAKRVMSPECHLKVSAREY